MSLSYQPLNVVAVRDPRTNVQSRRDYAVLRGGQQVSYKSFTTNSVSQSSIQFSAPPPSGGIIVDRKVSLTLPIRLTFTGPGTNTTNLIQSNRDAPRAFPLSNIIDTLQVSINNNSVSINLSDIIQALMRYNVDGALKTGDYSMTPCYQDQSQNYNELVGSVRNPLSSYGDSNDTNVQGRGGFPYTIVSNSPTAAVVDIVITEWLFLSPFYFGLGNGSGFVNVNSMDFNFTFLSSAGNKLWSHDNSLGTNVISSINATYNGFSAPAFSYSENQPKLNFIYISPNDLQIIPKNMPTTYPYFQVDRFPTDSQNAVAALATTVITSNNIQLNSVPRCMYIYARANNTSLNNSPNLPDVFFSIERISIQFNNYQGLLSQCSKFQLYQISTKNGCNLSWQQWAGDAVYQVGSTVNRLAGVGSVLKIEFGTDIGLNDLEAPGINGQFQLQMDVTVRNCNLTTAITPTLFIVPIYEGTFTIEQLGSSINQVGVISKTDVLNARQAPFVDYQDVQDVNGGNFFSSLKNFGQNLLTGLKDTKAISNVLGQIPNPYAQIGSQVARSVGLGEDMDEMEGNGVLVGGKMFTRAQLKRRLKY
jgi:hypothetical protein